MHRTGWTGLVAALIAGRGRTPNGGHAEAHAAGSAGAAQRR
jgi:hypothetical protein